MEAFGKSLMVIGALGSAVSDAVGVAGMGYDLHQHFNPANNTNDTFTNCTFSNGTSSNEYSNYNYMEFSGIIGSALSSIVFGTGALIYLCTGREGYKKVD